MPATLLACSPHLKKAKLAAEAHTHTQTCADEMKGFHFTTLLKFTLHLSFSSFLLPPSSSTNANRVAPGFSWRDLHSPSEGKSIWVAEITQRDCARALCVVTVLISWCLSQRRIICSQNSGNSFATVDTLPLHTYCDLALPSFSLADWDAVKLKCPTRLLILFPSFLVMHSKCVWLPLHTLLCVRTCIFSGCCCHCCSTLLLYSFTSLFII